MVGTLGHCIFKGVKVYDQQIDRFYAVCGHSQQVFVIIAQRQKRAVDIGVQGFHAAPHHLGKPRHIGHIAHAKPCCPQQGRCAAC